MADHLDYNPYVYITLANSNGSLSKKFKAIQGGYKKTYIKAGSEETTLSGGLDVCVGGRRRTHTLLLRVRGAEEDTSFGTLADLQTLWSYNNPRGTPSNIISFTDYGAGSPINVIFGRTFEPMPQTTMLVGGSALYFVQIQLIEIAAV